MKIRLLVFLCLVGFLHCYAQQRPNVIRHEIHRAIVGDHGDTIAKYDGVIDEPAGVSVQVMDSIKRYFKITDDKDSELSLFDMMLVHESAKFFGDPFMSRCQYVFDRDGKNQGQLEDLIGY